MYDVLYPSANNGAAAIQYPRAFPKDHLLTHLFATHVSFTASTHHHFLAVMTSTYVRCPQSARYSVANTET